MGGVVRKLPDTIGKRTYHYFGFKVVLYNDASEPYPYYFEIYDCMMVYKFCNIHNRKETKLGAIRQAWYKCRNMRERKNA